MKSGLSLEVQGQKEARRLLERAVDALEQRALQGSYHLHDIRKVARVAKLLGEQDLLVRVERLLQQMPDESFWVGMGRNPDPSKSIPQQWRTVAPHSKLEQDFPLYQESDVREYMEMKAEDDPYMALALERRYAEAFSLASPELAVIEIVITQAALGDFDAALESLQERVPESRQRGILVVLAVELYRAGQLERARAVLEDLESRGIGAGRLQQLALGFAGRRPWMGYPYPDW